MIKDFKRFIAKAVILSAAIALIGWMAFSLFIPKYYLPVFPYTLAFFLTVTVAVHAYRLKLARADMAKFTRNNMLLTFFKLIVYSIFAVAYIANDPENALAFVIALFLLYMVFSFLEVYEISYISRN